MFTSAYDFDENGVTAEALRRGPLSRLDRAQEFLRQFTFHIAPGSLLAASEIQRKMLYVQLARMGYIDRVTLLEVLAVPNIKQITERLLQDAEMGLVMEQNAAGRKSAGDKMPRMATKDGGSRPVITEA